MAEVDWGTEDNVAKPKKRIPTWAWIGGGCCGVVVIGIIAMIIASVVAMKTLTDQPKNWSSLAEHVQFDDSLKLNNKIARLPFQMGHDGAFEIQLHETLVYQVRVFDADGAFAMRKRVFEDKDTGAYQQLGVMRSKQIESGTIEVQGRSVARVRFVGREPSEDASEDEPTENAPGEAEDRSLDIGGIFMPSVSIVDITPEGASGLVLFLYVDRGRTAQVPDEDVIVALEPFHVGPNR